MPTVAREGQFSFVFNTRELPFEPPHLHAWLSNESVCRIELDSGAYMDNRRPDAGGTSWPPISDTLWRFGRSGIASTRGDRCLLLN